jgi:hypothetical protein
MKKEKCKMTILNMYISSHHQLFFLVIFFQKCEIENEKLENEVTLKGFNHNKLEKRESKIIIFLCFILEN